MVLRLFLGIWLIGISPYQLFSQYVSIIENSASPRYGQLIAPQAALAIGEGFALTDYSIKVFTGSGTPSPEQPAVLGRVEHDSLNLYFIPRFPFDLEQDYVALLVSAKDTLQQSFRVPSSYMPEAPKVINVQPGFKVPVNAIRFYVHFSLPMRRDNPYQHLSLVADDGTELQHVFFPADPALWDRNGTRLTVLLDPGRIKSGLDSHEAWGLALKPSKTYKLVINAAFTSFRGTPMATSYQHPFSTISEDRQSPDLKHWLLQSPEIGTQEPLMVVFDEPIDQAQAIRWIQVWKDNQEIFGEIDANTMGQWSFTPDEAWNSGKYHLKVNNQLEDLAGNSIRKPFELLGQPAESIAPKAWNTIPFSIQKEKP